MARDDLALGHVELLGQHIALGLDELVGADPWHAFQLVVEGFQGHPAGQVVAVGVEQAAQGLRRQPAAELEGARCHGFADEQEFEQHGAGL